MIISKEFRFEASHVLPKHSGKCSRLHGHSWKMVVSVKGPVNPETGFVMDYGILKDLVNSNIIDLVDHKHLGHGGTGIFPSALGDHIYPSSENLVRVFATILERPINKWNPEVVLHAIELNETCTSAARWERE